MSFLGPCNIGDIVLMQSFTSWSPDLQVTRKPKRTHVAVFVLLGTQPKNGSAPLNLEAAMNQLGWVRDKVKRVT